MKRVKPRLAWCWYHFFRKTVRNQKRNPSSVVEYPCDLDCTHPSLGLRVLKSGRAGIPRLFLCSGLPGIPGSRTASHPPGIQPGFCVELCASQTLGYSGRKLVPLPNKISCSLISHNSAESNHNSGGNKKLPGSPPQLIPDKHACPGSFLNPP